MNAATLHHYRHFRAHQMATWDRENNLIYSGYGHAADVQWGALQEGTPVWTWYRKDWEQAQKWKGASKPCEPNPLDFNPPDDFGRCRGSGGKPGF